MEIRQTRGRRNRGHLKGSELTEKWTRVYRIIDNVIWIIVITLAALILAVFLTGCSAMGKDGENTQQPVVIFSFMSSMDVFMADHTSGEAQVDQSLEAKESLDLPKVAVPPLNLPK